MRFHKYETSQIYSYGPESQKSLKGLHMSIVDNRYPPILTPRRAREKKNLRFLTRLQKQMSES